MSKGTYPSIDAFSLRNRDNKVKLFFRYECV